MPSLTDPDSYSNRAIVAWRAYLVSGTAMLVVGISAIARSSAANGVVLGLLSSLLLGVACECLWRLRENPAHVDDPSLLEIPLHLAHDTRLFEEYEGIARSLLSISRHYDPIYRSVALDQLSKLVKELEPIAAGTLVFEGTETWRIVYEALLRSPGLHSYRSVAWVKDCNYWHDEPGRKSMAVNFELHAGERLTIERIAIIADELWPLDEPLPAERIHNWIREQYQHGIDVKMVRESALVTEPDLIADIGIYGCRALGRQELDDASRTVRFTLTFDYEQVKAAEASWQKLSVYATPYGAWLDQFDVAV